MFATKLAITLGLIICSACCFSQTFNGFSLIRMGKNELEFLNDIKKETSGDIKIVTEKNLSKIKNEWIKYQLDKKEPLRVYQLKYKGDYLNWPFVLYKNESFECSKFQDSCSIYFLPKYKVGDIELENIFIVFKNKRLQLIELNDNSDLLKAAKEKYTPSQANDTAYKIKCVYVTSGVPEEKLVSKRNSEWIYDNYTIEASSGLDYNEKCKAIYWGYIRFISTDITEFLSKNASENKKQLQEKDSNKINSVKDKL
jgi:hypothetical protein